MAVTTIDIIPKTSSSPLSSNNPSMNKRWPPLADKTSLPYKLTTLSRQKLAREATAPDPDIRRCLGHFRLHCRSMEWAQKDMSTRINSFEMEDDESEDEEDREDENKKLFDDRKDEDQTSIKPASTEPADKATSELETTTVHVSFHVSTPSAADKEKEKEKEGGLLEKGRNCLEKTVQRNHFWPSPGQCLPVRIAG